MQITDHDICKPTAHGAPAWLSYDLSPPEPQAGLRHTVLGFERVHPSTLSRALK